MDVICRGPPLSLVSGEAPLPLETSPASCFFPAISRALEEPLSVSQGGEGHELEHFF